MAYDRYDSRDERSRWSGDRPRDRDWDRDRGRDRSDPEDRGFFERAGDEIASWFGDDDAERRRRDEHRTAGPPPRHDRGPRPEHGPRNEWDRERERGGYRPLTGDYGRARSDDPHYHSWRHRQMAELDRDYEDYAARTSRASTASSALARDARGAQARRCSARSASIWK